MLISDRASHGIGLARFVEGLLLVAAAGLLVGSLSLPYWTITLRAPQYPLGLRATAFADRLTGDIDEIDGLNHYIGMMKLGEAARVERGLVWYAVPAIAGLAVVSVFARGLWAWLLRAPLILFPLVFSLDLWGWLRYAGHHLDPKAALSSSIKPFSPALLGESRIAQFKTIANFEAGFWLVVIAAALALLAGFAGRRRAEGRGR